MDVNELIAKIELRSKQYAEDHHVKRDDDWFLLKIQEEFGELTQKYLMLTNRARQKEMSKEGIRKDLELPEDFFITQEVGSVQPVLTLEGLSPQEREQLTVMAAALKTAPEALIERVNQGEDLQAMGAEAEAIINKQKGMGAM